MERRRTDDGFSLIELAVVVFVLGILLFLAIPTFSGSKERAGDRQAQTTAKLAHRAEQVHITGGDDRTFTTSPGVLKAAESSLNYEAVPAAPTAPVPTETADSETAFVQTTPDQEVTCVSGVSPSGKVFTIMDAGVAGTVYRQGNAIPTCDGDVKAEGWKRGW